MHSLGRRQITLFKSGARDQTWEALVVRTIFASIGIGPDALPKTFAFGAVAQTNPARCTSAAETELLYTIVCTTTPRNDALDHATLHVSLQGIKSRRNDIPISITRAPTRFL